MSKVDGRKLSHNARAAIRIEAIQKWRDGAAVKSLAAERKKVREFLDTRYPALVTPFEPVSSYTLIVLIKPNSP